MIPRNLLPAWATSWCVAGGWAACPALAGDCDVWIYGLKDLAQAREDMQRHLVLAYGDDFEPLTDTSARESYDHIVNTWKVGKVYDADARRDYEVMVCDAETIGDILNTFDISTHMVAIDQYGGLVRSENWTPTRVPPVVVNGGHPKTPERFKKICQRFGHTAIHDRVLGLIARKEVAVGIGA